MLSSASGRAASFRILLAIFLNSLKSKGIGFCRFLIQIFIAPLLRFGRRRDGVLDPSMKDRSQNSSEALFNVVKVLQG